MEKLYVVVRSDLSPGLQVAQACHALRQFVEDHPGADRAWYEGSNNLVVLQVPNEGELLSLVGRVGAEAPVSVFREPDLADRVTAVAIGPAGARSLRGLALALRQAELV